MLVPVLRAACFKHLLLLCDANVARQRAIFIYAFCITSRTITDADIHHTRYCQSGSKFNLRGWIPSSQLQARVEHQCMSVQISTVTSSLHFLTIAPNPQH